MEDLWDCFWVTPCYSLRSSSHFVPPNSKLKVWRQKLEIVRLSLQHTVMEQVDIINIHLPPNFLPVQCRRGRTVRLKGKCLTSCLIWNKRRRKFLIRKGKRKRKGRMKRFWIKISRSFCKWLTIDIDKSRTLSVMDLFKIYKKI